MGQSNRRWIIRDASGQIDGPFTTEKVLYKIGRGEISGEESIAHYPDGKWIAISQDPQFYDKLLDVLADKQNEEPSAETRVLEFTRAQKTEVKNTDPGTATAQTTTKKVGDEDTATEATPVLPLKPNQRSREDRKSRRRKKIEDIELIDTRSKLWKEIFLRARIPIFLGAGAIALASVWYVGSSTNEERIHLVGPQKNATQVVPESLGPRIRIGRNNLNKDTFDGYIHAENDYVFITEHNNKNAEAMAELCITYLNLWPYAYQDSSDTKVIAAVVQQASTVDPAGLHSATCRAVDLIVRGRFQEAKSLVEAMLDARANEAQPPIEFYFLKGYLLAGTNDSAAAADYFASTERLMPNWLLPYVMNAQALTKMERYNEAATLYRQVLHANPAHTVARIELGILEYKYFDHYNQGEQFLNQALDNEDAPRPILSRGYFGLAEIALKRSEQKKALQYAQKAFALNSSNVSAKNLIVQLGGIEKLKNIKVKGQQLLFEGDQFAREGDCQAAQAHYKAAFEEDQRNAYAALKAAQCLWKLSFSTEAIEWLNRSIKADPKLMEAYVTLADYQAQRYNFLAATHVMEAAKHISPRSSEVYRGFALVELKKHNAAGALAFGKIALQLYDTDVETQIIMAQASLALHDYKMAYNYAAKAAEIDVNNRQAQIIFAEALAGLQGVDVGVDYLLKQVNNYPQVTEYRLALGKMLLDDERYQQAEEIFRQVVKLEEKPKEAYMELAKSLRAQGNMGEALDLLLKAAVLDPSDAEPLFLAGNIYLDLKKPQEASVQFQRVLTINKLYPSVHYQLGRTAFMQSDPRETLNQTEAEKRANPNMADAYLLAAEAYTMMQQYTNCASEYQKAIKLRPQQANIYVKIAQCYRKAGNLDAASAMLNVAATKENGLADIYKEQGAIYELKGDVVHAIEAYNQYFVLDPDAPDRGQIEERISALQRGQTP